MALEKIRELITSINKPILSAVLILTVFGLFLRFYALGSQSVWLDEAISGIAAEKIQPFGYPLLPSGSEYTRGVLHTLFIGLSYQVFGQGELAGRLPAAILGTLSIPLGYLLGKKVKNERVGILIAFLLTFSTVQIAWSRQIRFYQQLQFFFILSLYLLERLLDEMSWKNLALVSISILCMTFSHDSLGNLLAGLLVVWFLIEKGPWLRGKISDINQMKPKDRVLTALFSLILFGGVIFKGPAVISSIQSWIGVSVDYLSYYFTHLWTEMGIFLLLALPGMFLGLLRRKRNYLYAALILILYYIVSRHISGLHYRYVFVLFPLFFLFAGLFLDLVYEKINDFTARFGKEASEMLPMLVLILILIPAIYSGSFTFIPKSHYDLSETAPQSKFEPAYSYVENNWRENDVIISTLTPITWYYLNRSDYWISFSYWGKGTYPGEDAYTNAGVIENVENLQKVEDRSSGWVVIETMGKGRIKEEVVEHIENNYNLIEHYSGEDKGVWLYRWK